MAVKIICRVNVAALLGGSMEQEDLYQAIFRRKSVRTYSPEPLDADTLATIGSRIAMLRPLIPGIRTEMRIVRSGEVKGWFMVDAPHFLALFSEDKKGYLANAGFLLQQMDLFLSSKGIGSCWQGGPKLIGDNKYSAGLEFVILLAFGKPAEVVHRNGAGEFKRSPLAKVTDAKDSDALLEPARLAPSAANNQPWYFKREGGGVHAYCAKSLIMERLNRISAGIALCHIWLAAGHSGKPGEILVDEGSGPAPPRGYSYVASVRLG